MIYFASDNYVLEEVKDDGAYATVLVSSWIGSLVLCIFMYGIGVIVEELRQGNTYAFKILDK